MSLVALSELLGAAVRDAHGVVQGRVREVAVAPQEHLTRIAFLIVQTSRGERVLSGAALKSCTATSVKTDLEAADWENYTASDGTLLLKRDLLDQQIIDVHGRKVVRVNDVEIDATPVNGHVAMNVVSVDVGARGASRRLAQGIVPGFTLRALLSKIPPRAIPWQENRPAVETDPARRVKLKIAYEGLSTLHPADIADIVEDLAPAEREAVFETIDEEVAAEALEEVDPRVQVSIVESLDSNRAADIVEEMGPRSPRPTCWAIFRKRTRARSSSEMWSPEERHEVTQLLEFKQNTAAGHMTTDFLSFPEAAVVNDVIEALKIYEGGAEAVATIYVTGPKDTLVGFVSLVKIATSPGTTPLFRLAEKAMSCAPDTPEDDVAELFDKYNLMTLPVVDEDGRPAGIITADDVITMLRRNE